MRTILFVLLAALLTHNASAADKLQVAIERGLVTKEMLNALADDDVPKKWCSKVVDQSDDGYVRKAFSRGSERVLVVSWNREWTGTRSNMFAAHVFDGKRRICRIMKYEDGTTSVIPLPKSVGGYLVSTDIKQDGSISVTVMNDTGFLETVKVRGRDTHLINDLDYTKAAVGVEKIGRPLAEAIENEINRPPQKTGK